MPPQSRLQGVKGSAAEPLRKIARSEGSEKQRREESDGGRIGKGGKTEQEEKGRR